MMTSAPATSTLKSWLLLPIALLCLPADWIGILWFVYHLVSEQKIVHSRMYDLLIFAAYTVVGGFGLYLWGLAFILWSVLIFSKAQGRVKAIASAPLLLALLGTFKAGWVIGIRY